MLLAALALLAGLWAGLIRLGWQLPPLWLRLPAQHGPLMVSGFLGTLISLERAVALSQNQDGRRLYYLSPLLAGIGAVGLFFTLPTAVPRGLSTLGALGLLHLSLVMRVMGDWLLWLPLRRWGGLLNEVAVVLFLLVTAVVAIYGRKKS